MEKFEINGRKYGYHPMLPIPAVHFSIRAGSQLAVPVAALLESYGGDMQDLMDDDAVDGEGLFEKWMTGCMKALPYIQADEFCDLMLDAISIAACDSGKLSEELVRDEWFDKHKGDYIPVALKIIWETCKDFLLGAIPGLAQLLFQEAPEDQASTFPTTTPSTGSSVELPPAPMPSAPMQT